MQRSLYFAYGTNIPSVLMKRRCKDAVKLGFGFIKDYQLLFGSGGFATIVPRAGAKVPVAIWAVSDSDWDQLDAYESYPNYYEKTTVTVELADSSQWGNLDIHEDGTVDAVTHPNEVNGVVYYMRGDHKVSHPNTSAIRAADEGYQEFGMPMEFLTEAITLSVMLCDQRLWEVREKWLEAKS